MPDIVVVCPRCKREVNPWPLFRGKRCSPADWVYCIRNDDEIMDEFWRQHFNIINVTEVIPSG